MNSFGIYRFLPLITFIIVVAGPAFSQPVTTPESMGMGGAGTAYLRGIQSMFYNPANTHLADSSHTFQISLGTISGHFDPIHSKARPTDQWRHYRDYLNIYEARHPRLTELQRLEFLENQYEKNQALSSYNARFETIPLALSFHGNKYTLSIALRTRISSRFSVGRGWYDDNLVTRPGNQQVLDRSLIQRYQNFHELSLSYAQPLTYINGLSPSLGRFYIGIAPKFLFGGAFMEADYQLQYLPSKDLADRKIQSFDYKSSGAFSNLARKIRGGANPLSAINNTLSRTNLSKSSGYGMGVDFGLTYIQPIGTQLVRQAGKSYKLQSRDKVLALSLSITDVGYYFHRNSPLQIKNTIDTTRTPLPSNPPLSSEIFTGAPGQYHFFMNQYNPENPSFESGRTNTENFTQLLPGSINGGIMIRYNQVTVSGDVQAVLSESNFYHRGLSIYTGIEFRPFPVWPIRTGLQIRSNNKSYISFGTGIDSKNLSFNLGVQFSGEANRINTKLNGAALTTLVLKL